MNIFKAIKYLLRDISPVQINSATADLEPIEKEYKPQEVALDIEEAQLKAYNNLLFEVVELIHKVAVNSITAQLYFEHPKVAMLYEENPGNEALKKRIDFEMKKFDKDVDKDNLFIKILTDIFEMYPAIRAMNQKVSNG